MDKMCSWAVEQLSAFIDQALSREEEILVRDHIKLCERCNREYLLLIKNDNYIRNLPSKVPVDLWSAIEKKLGVKAITKTKYHLLTRIAMVAAAIFIFAGIYLLFIRTEQPPVIAEQTFEHIFPNNGGSVRSKGSCKVVVTDEHTFRLERGTLELKLNKNFKAQGLTIQTEEGVIRILEADPDGTVDVEVIIEADKKSVIKVRSGVLEVTNRADPSKKTRASVGDTVSLSKEDMVIKSIKLLKEDSLFKDLYKRDPEFVETLDKKDKITWASFVGEKLNENPDLLTPKHRIILAHELLKDNVIADKLKRMFDVLFSGRDDGIKNLAKLVNKHEEWFYIGLLEAQEVEVRCVAPWVLSVIADNLDGKLLQEAAEKLIVVTEDKDVEVRMAACHALKQISLRTDKKLFERIVKLLIKMIDDSHPWVRDGASFNLAVLAGHRIKHLEVKLLEEIIAAIEKALNGEEVEVLRFKFRRILTTLKERKQELEQKNQGEK